MTYTLDCNGKPFFIDHPLVMGILNLTTDSFYQGSRVQSAEDVVSAALRMDREGADIIDLGAQSTRPGSFRLTASEEMDKLKNVLPALRRSTAKLISIDTYHSEMAKFAVDLGVDIINDISGGTMDEMMIPTVGRLRVPYICMHIKGTPETMQQMTDYDDILSEIIQFFVDQLEKCRQAGIHDVIIDPGFGFAKTIDQNLFLLRNLSEFRIFNRPLMVGLSRKSTIYKTLGVKSDDALNGTTVLNTLAIQNGAQLLRVHDVKEAREVITLMTRYLNAEKGSKAVVQRITTDSQKTDKP